jgi:hypothetical protein
MAYVDESGDKGLRGSTTYALGCVMVSDVDWPAAFDALLGFRRFLRDRYSIWYVLK